MRVLKFDKFIWGITILNLTIIWIKLDYICKEQIHRKIRCQDGVAAGIAKLSEAFVWVDAVAGRAFIVVCPEWSRTMMKILKCSHDKQFENKAYEEKLALTILIERECIIEQE